MMSSPERDAPHHALLGLDREGFGEDAKGVIAFLDGLRIVCGMHKH